MTSEKFLTTAENKLVMECIHCGLCLDACPTYRALGKEADSPRGRLFLLRAVDEGQLPDASGAYAHLDRCLGCLACAGACPAGVQYGSILDMARSAQRKVHPLSRLQRISLSAVTNFRWLSMLTYFLRAVQLMRLDWLAAKLPLVPKLLRRQVLGLPKIEIESGYKAGDILGALNIANEARGRVVLFTGCVMDKWYRSVHAATIRIIRWNGFEVQLFAKESCCGALHTHAGLTESGAAMATNALRMMPSNTEGLIVNAAGCGHQLKAHSNGIEIYDIAEWLAGRINNPPKIKLNDTVAYDHPCHLIHGQKVAQAPLNLLNFGCESVITLEDSEVCCGSAGLYSVFQSELSQKVTAPKIANLCNSTAQIVATGNPGCQMQLQSSLRAVGSQIAVMHTVEVLDSAYRQDKEYCNIYGISGE